MIRKYNCFFEDIKKSVEKDESFLIAYYGASTTSQEYMFPNWGEIIRYTLKYAFENEDEGEDDYKKYMWNIHTINLGLDGASSTDLLERFDNLVLSKKPNIIFLDASKNDVYYKIDKKVTENNNKKLIKKALDKGIKVVFTARIPSLRENLNKKIIEYNEIDKKIAKEFSENKNFIFIDLFNIFPKTLIKESYTLIHPISNEYIGIKAGEIDPIHYNKLGNVIVSKILLKEVFNIDFDENKFLKDLSDNTKMFPDY